MEYSKEELTEAKRQIDSALEKAERNANYLKKLERGLDQICAGQGITKTMTELEAMEEDGL